MTFDENEYSGNPGGNPTALDMLKKIWYNTWRLQSGSAPGSGLTDTQLRASPVPVSGQSVTPNFEDLTAGQSQVIPIGAKGYFVIILTGTATVNSKTAPAGAAFGDNNTLLATVTVACGTPGTAFVAWNT